MYVGFIHGLERGLKGDIEGLYKVYIGMENQMEKNLENEIKTGLLCHPP